MQSMPIPSAPFELVGVDIIGPLPPTKTRKNKYILVFTDYLTRWVEAFAMPNQKAITVARKLVEEIICRHGAPVMLLSDQGSNFLSKLAHNVYIMAKIKKIQTTAYHPQTNGLTERFNKTLCEMLSMFVNIQQDDWDRYLPFVLFAYRTAYHSSAHEQPFYLLYGREPRLPIDAALNDEEETLLPELNIHA